MEGERVVLDITVKKTKNQLEVIKTELDKVCDKNEEIVSLKDM